MRKTDAVKEDKGDIEGGEWCDLYGFEHSTIRKSESVSESKAASGNF